MRGFRPWLAQAWRENRWTVLLLMSLVALGLGYVGFQENGRATGQQRSVGDLIYLAVHLFTILAKLEAVGCGLAPKAEGLWHRLEFQVHEIERLAKMEHERWRAERTRAGWTHAPGPRDNAVKTNPLLVPWEHLEGPAQESNREPIRELPKLLERCGFRIYRTR